MRGRSTIEILTFFVEIQKRAVIDWIFELVRRFFIVLLHYGLYVMFHNLLVGVDIAARAAVSLGSL